MVTQTFAKIAVIDKKSNVLLLRRDLRSPYRPGKWDFPGGQIQPAEEILEGAIREAKEETGLNVTASQLQLVFAGTTAYTGKSITRLLFIVHVAGRLDITLSDEHEDFLWVNIETALDELDYPFYADGLAYAADHDLL